MSIASVVPCIYYVGSVLDIARRHGQADLSVAAGRENRLRGSYKLSDEEDRETPPPPRSQK